MMKKLLLAALAAVVVCSGVKELGAALWADHHPVVRLVRGQPGGGAGHRGAPATTRGPQRPGRPMGLILV